MVSALHIYNLLKFSKKKFIRVITGSDYNAHTTNLFKSTGVLKLKDIHRFVIAQNMFKIVNSPSYTPSTHNCATRHNLDIQPVFQRLSLTQRSLNFVGPKVWNSLPISIRQIKTLGKFKSEARKHFLSNYCDSWHFFLLFFISWGNFNFLN